MARQLLFHSIMKNAEQIMSKKLVTIGYESSLEAAYEKMQSHRIRHLPVTDDHGAVIGILSDRDLQRAMQAEVTGIDTEITFDAKHQVKDFMSFPVLEVRSDVEVSHIVDRMLKEKVSSYLVFDKKGTLDPIGIITTDDLLKLLAKLLEKDSKNTGRMTLSELFLKENIVI